MVIEKHDLTPSEFMNEFNEIILREGLYGFEISLEQARWYRDHGVTVEMLVADIIGND